MLAFMLIVYTYHASLYAGSNLVFSYDFYCCYSFCCLLLFVSFIAAAVLLLSLHKRGT